MGNYLHFKEDTAKPENRTNLALFSILMIPEIHSFVCNELGLPDDIIIFPSPNLVTEEFGSTMRPDYGITESYAEQSKPIGYIEVELGKEDEPQVQKYRTELKVTIYSIVGRKDHRENGGRGDLSLEEIYRVALEIGQSCPNTQKHASLDLFCSLVKHYVIDGNFNASNKRCNLSEEMLNSPLIQKVISYYGESTIFEGGRIERGKILLDTIAEKGFSFKVYCRESGNNQFSLMSRTSGRNEITFPSLCKLKKYFPRKEEETALFAKIIADLGDDEIYDLGERKRARLPIETVEEHFEKIGDVLKRFL
ncbi:MAG: hypothetical protein RTV31_16885 [Candidatus Thorarchaeota archaeon]